MKWIEGKITGHLKSEEKYYWLKRPCGRGGPGIIKIRYWDESLDPDDEFEEKYRNSTEIADVLYFQDRGLRMCELTPETYTHYCPIETPV